MGRDRQPVEEALESEAGQDEIEVLASRLGEVQEALADRRAEIRDFLLQDSASRYGRITRATLQIWA